MIIPNSKISDSIAFAMEKNIEKLKKLSASEKVSPEKFLKKLNLETFMGGNIWYLDITQDTFVHFTTKSLAESINKDEKLKTKLVIDGNYSSVFAISTIYGKLEKGVQITHIKTTKDNPIVSVFFTTKTIPRISYREEVSWNEDVIFSWHKITTMEEGIDKINASPINLPEHDAVTYNLNDLEKYK